MRDEEQSAPDASRRQFLQMAVPTLAMAAGNFTGDSKPSADEVTNAFWNACHGGQLEAARYLLALSFFTQQRHRPHTRSRSAFTQAYTLRPWDDFRLSDHFNWFSSISELKHTSAEGNSEGIIQLCFGYDTILERKRFPPPV